MELKLQQSACSGTHETRLLFVFRREGICVDRSAINLDTSTGSRSPVKNFGRFSFRGPSRLARKMAVRETRLTCTPTHVKTYPKGSGHFSSTTRARQTPCLFERLSHRDSCPVCLCTGGACSARRNHDLGVLMSPPGPSDASCHNSSASHVRVGAQHCCAPCPQDHVPFRPRVLATTPPPTFREFPPLHIETALHLPYYSPHRRCPSRTISQSARFRPSTRRAPSFIALCFDRIAQVLSF